MSGPGQRTDYLQGDALNELFLKLPEPEVQEIAREVHKACVQRGITYVDEDGSTRIIPMMLRPRPINPVQRSYFHYVCLQVVDALKKLCTAYLGDPQVRRILPIRAGEEQWLLQAWGEKIPRYHTVISRLDVNTEFSAADWRENFQFFEVNSVGIGGLYYSTVAEQIILDVVVPHLRRLDAELHLEPNDDTRDLLLDSLRLHCRSIGRRRCNIAVLDDPRNVGGITEYPRLVEHFRAWGHEAVVADPREIRLRRDELYYRDLALDVLYRDVELRQLVDLENAEGRDLSAIKVAFQRNQVVSSLAGDFDHKSCWEVFTDDRFAPYFTAAQWRIFQRHMLWTRLIRETMTADETGRMVELVPYVRTHHDRLVIKPNRSFGGEGVIIGPEASASAWDAVVQKAVAEPYTYVVQRYTPVHAKQFPILNQDGTVTSEEFFSTCGFTVTAKDMGIVGRASKQSVVNIAQRGALATVLMILDQQRC